MEFRRLKADEIELRIGNVFPEKGVTLLMYQNARCGMDILDETVGAENWQREHYEVKGNMFCKIGIRQTYIHTGTDGKPDYIEYDWVWKSDCGTESNTEKEKGEASDSFKRACVNWGIGRELYTAPLIWISLPAKAFNENGRVTTDYQKKIRGFKVQEIQCDAKEISRLVIVDKEGSVVYKWTW